MTSCSHQHQQPPRPTAEDEVYRLLLDHELALALQTARKRNVRVLSWWSTAGNLVCHVAVFAWLFAQIGRNGSGGPALVGMWLLLLASVAHTHAMTMYATMVERRVGPHRRRAACGGGDGTQFITSAKRITPLCRKLQ